MGKGQVLSPEPLMTLGVRPLFIFSTLNYTILSSPWCRRARFGVPKMIQNLASNFFPLKLLFDNCPGQRAAAKNRKKHKDKGADWQRPGLKSRTFDNFGVHPLFIFSSLNYTVLSSPWYRRVPFWGVPKMVQNLASKAFTLKLLFDGRPGQANLQRQRTTRNTRIRG